MLRCKLDLVHLLQLLCVSQLRARLSVLCDTRINVIVDRILDAAKAETAVKYGAAVFFVALAEARVLVQLREYLVQCRDRVIVL